MTDTVSRNPTFLAIRHAVPSWSLSMSPISRNAPRASRQHPQKQDRPGGRGDTIAFPVAALLEWLAAPVTQACHYVAYPTPRRIQLPPTNRCAVRFWPDSAVAGIREARKLSRGKQPSAAM